MENEESALRSTGVESCGPISSGSSEVITFADDGTRRVLKAPEGNNHLLITSVAWLMQFEDINIRRFIICTFFGQSFQGSPCLILDVIANQNVTRGNLEESNLFDEILTISHSGFSFSYDRLNNALKKHGKVSNNDREKKEEKKKEDTTRSPRRNVDAKEREHGLRKNGHSGRKIKTAKPREEQEHVALEHQLLLQLHFAKYLSNWV
ncbi:hypothetical protein M513_05195 [Trichuris suis]|uniref:Uncharacterized protein n=1 Tax=Trichuris suis TaxID=68888 RepID=A0A085M9N2_9BILA|nr:hypothetical protein M513_05195 [Trichuris suis]